MEPRDDVQPDPLERAMIEWSAAARVDAARADRRSHHWNSRLAAEDARFSSLLADLQERAEIVSLATTTGSTFAGTIAELGADFVAITSAPVNDIRAATTSTPAFVRIDAVTSIETADNGNRTPSSGLRLEPVRRQFRDVIDELAADTAVVRFGTRTATHTRVATIVSSGIDVVTLRLDTTPSRTLFVATEQITELVTP